MNMEYALLAPTIKRCSSLPTRFRLKCNMSFRDRTRCELQ